MRVPPAQPQPGMPQAAEPVGDVYLAMAEAQYMEERPELMRIPTQTDQPDVPTDHPDFDGQVDAYFTHKQIKDENIGAAKWRTPIEGEVQN